MAHNFRLQFITVGNLRWQELEAAHYITLSLEQRTIHECIYASAQLTHSTPQQFRVLFLGNDATQRVGGSSDLN